MRTQRKDHVNPQWEGGVTGKGIFVKFAVFGLPESSLISEILGLKSYRTQSKHLLKCHH